MNVCVYIYHSPFFFLCTHIYIFFFFYDQSIKNVLAPYTATRRPRLKITPTPLLVDYSHTLTRVQTSHVSRASTVRFFSATRRLPPPATRGLSSSCRSSYSSSPELILLPTTTTTVPPAATGTGSRGVINAETPRIAQPRSACPVPVHHAAPVAVDGFTRALASPRNGWGVGKARAFNSFGGESFIPYARQR